MADAPSAEDAATELGDGDSRLVRERHRRQDVGLFKTSLGIGQEVARRSHEDAPTAGKAALEAARQHPHRRNCHAHPRHLPRRLLNAERPRPSHHHCHLRRLEDRAFREEGECAELKADASYLLSSAHSSPVSFGDDEDEDDADDGDGEDDDEEEEHEEEEEKEHRVAVAEEYRVGAPRIVVAASLVEDESSSSNGDGGADGAGMIGNATRAADAASAADARRSSRPASGVLLPLPQTNALNITSRLPGVNDRQSNHDSTPGKPKSRGGSGDGVSKSAANLASEGQQSYIAAAAVVGILAREIEAEAANDKSVGTSGSDNISSDIGATSALGASIVSAATSTALAPAANSSSSSTILLSVSGGVSGGVVVASAATPAPSTILASSGRPGAATNGCTPLDSSDTVVATLLSVPVVVPISVGMAAASPMVVATGGMLGANGILAARQQQQGSPFKGQVRTAEDTLDGPCGKKRCADRYDSSESSDSGVAVSCGECSSSGTSDITEPGSPCSTSSDEGVAAVRGASASPLLCLPKLAPCSQIGTRPQWPWTPPLAATACSTFKRHKGEPEAGALPRSGAADPTSRVITKPTTKSNHHHESQGKITEYFKTQIKPQQPKIKKTSESMSVLVAKNTTEFRRPPTVQRNKGGLAKYLGSVSTSARGTPTSNWESRTLTMSPPPTKKPAPVVVPRVNGKLEKKVPKPLPGLPISNDVLKNLPGCKISSIRLTSETSANMKSVTASPAQGTTVQTVHESATLDFKGCILSKPHVNENNNLMNGCGSILSSSRSQTGHDPLSRLSVPEESKSKESQVSPPEEDEEEEEDSRSSESKASLSPILSAPTTIRFPAREPEKDRQQGTDSGVCRWDKCEASFECSSSLLEHLQVAHINTQTGGDNFVCHWQGCKVQGRSSCSRRWLERHVLSHGGNKPFRCIVDGCGSRFSSQTALERHVNSHFNQPETSSSSGRRSCENGGKLVRRNGKRLRYRRQPWSARLFDYFDSGVMEGLQHRLLELAKSRTQGQLAETPGNSMALTSQVLARRVELDGKTKVLLRWYPQDIEPDEWVLESEVQNTKYVGIREVAAARPEEVSLALYPAMRGGNPPLARVKQRRKSVKNS